VEERAPALLALNPHEARTAAALFERIFPADENGPGAQEIGVVAYVDRALAGAYRDRVETYRLGLEALDRAAKGRFDGRFADCGPEGQRPLRLRRSPHPDVSRCQPDADDVGFANTSNCYAWQGW
jgi:hypothetical protein